MLKLPLAKSQSLLFHESVFRFFYVSSTWEGHQPTNLLLIWELDCYKDCIPGLGFRIHNSLYKLPSWELTYLLPAGTFKSMMFHFHFGGIS